MTHAVATFGSVDREVERRSRAGRPRVPALLTTEDTDVLFVAGCEENQAKFRTQFDHIVQLSAPLKTLVERLATRTNNTCCVSLTV